MQIQFCSANYSRMMMNRQIERLTLQSEVLDISTEGFVYTRPNLTKTKNILYVLPY